MLARNLDGYKEHGKSWKNQFNPTSLKKTHEFLSEVSAATLQQAARNLQSSYEGWFKSLSGKRKGKRLNKPTFKAKHRTRKSFRLPNQKFSLGDQWIKLEKLGRVKAVIDRQVPSEAKLVSVTVSQDASG
jgi:putative transposase